MDLVDITDEVESVLESSGINNGHVTVFAKEHSCALILNEHEHGLWADLKSTLDRFEERERPGAEEGHPNERRTTIGSSSVVLPAVDGRLHLGIWQRVLLIELEGPAKRSVHVQIVGE